MLKISERWEHDKCGCPDIICSIILISYDSFETAEARIDAQYQD